MAEIQLLVGNETNREALASLVEQHFTVTRSDTVEAADLYVVDDYSLPEYRDALRERQREVAPVFCPVVLVRRESTRIDLPLPEETDAETLLIDEVVTAPVEPAVFARRLWNLLQRRKRDEASREAEQRHRRVMQMLPVGVVEATREDGGTLEFVNDRFVDMMDAESAAEIKERDVSDMYVDPDEREALMARLENGEHLEDEEVRLETNDGEEFWASLTVHRHDGDGQDRQIAAISDVTQRREYRERIEEIADRMETVNRIVRHDIMNKLSVIRLTADAMEPAVDGTAATHLDRIAQSNETAIDLLEQMREVVETTLDGTIGPEPVSLDAHLQPAVEGVRDSFPDATIRLDTDIPTRAVLAGDLLQSVFRNLLRNAIQHNDDDPTVTVSVAKDDEAVEVAIADDGPGIPADTRNSLFDKGNKGAASEGTGIGLYLVDTLVSQFDAEIRVEANEPTGTVFTVRLRKAT